jgi:hypothetical protein
LGLGNHFQPPKIIVMKSLLLCVLAFFIFINTKAQEVRVTDADGHIDALDLSRSKYQYSFKSATDRINMYKNKRFDRHRRAGVVGERYDAGSCWFDLKKLEDFKKAINDLLDPMHTGKDVVSGFRFYYITYKRKDTLAPQALWDATDGKTKKIHTLLIVATHCVTKTGKDGKSYCLETDIVDRSQKLIAALVILQTRGGNTTFENGGTLCPPEPASACGGASLINELYPPHP